MQRERRQHFRAKIKWPVIVKRSGGNLEGEILNFSTHSAFIRCSRPLKLNEVFDMTINAPERRLLVNAEVVWSNIYGRDDDITPRGMGVRFLSIASEDQEFIARVVANQSVGRVANEYLKTLEKQIRNN